MGRHGKNLNRNKLVEKYSINKNRYYNRYKIFKEKWKGVIMINLEKAEKNFKDYLKDYDLNNGNIKLKIKHTYEVMKIHFKRIKFKQRGYRFIKINSIIT